MTQHDTQSAERIQALLDERLKVLQWIDKLNGAPDDIPADVRDRVKADYQTRLDGVAAELQNYTSELQAKLLEQQHLRDQLAGDRQQAETRLAEAKLRHAVGEFGDDQWNQLNGEISGELSTLGGRLDGADQEIKKLEEVLALIRQKPPSTQVRAAIPMVEPPPSPPAQSAPAAAPLVTPPQSDEMAFINSVSGGNKPPGAVEVTHGTPAPGTVEAVPAAPPPVASPPAPESQTPETASGPQKTLKCGECGVMNFPTEWYCERCGAELAAL